MFVRFTALLCLFFSVSALTAASLTGQVTDPSGSGIPNVEILLDEGNKTATDDEGRFAFSNLSAGTYRLVAKAPGYQSSAARVLQITHQQEKRMDLVLRPLLQADATLTVTGQSRSTAELSQVVDVLAGEELEQLRRVSLGDTLSSRPGISSTSFGPTAGRPIIRGMGGGRIRVLEGGLGTGDVSTTSVDHVITADMASVSQVEILRGASALRYGGSAVGGVVNMLDGRIPSAPTTQKIGGSLELDADTVADHRGGRLQLEGGQGAWAWQANTTDISTENYEIPGPAERFPGPGEEIEDTLTDSAMDLSKSGVGFSYNSARGAFGIAYTDYQNDYGVPGHAHEDGHGHGHEEEGEEPDGHGEEEEGVLIDLQQRRFDVKGELMLTNPVLQQLNLELAGTDYEHVEAEGDNLGTRFTNEYVEARLEAVTGPWGFFDQGGIGLHYSERDFAALGEEAFVQPNTSEGLGVFITQEKVGNNWNLTTGVRYDQRSNDGSIIEGHHHEDEHGHDEDHDDDHDKNEDHGLEEEHEELFFDRNFDVVSGAVGFVYGTQSTYSLAANLTHTERAPTAEALFASGAHIPTRTFEIGDPLMNKEVGRGLDLRLRKQKGRVTGEISLFFMDFEDYIYQSFTGEEIDGLPETLFTQTDSESYGGEAQLNAALLEGGPHRLDLRLTYDQVRSSLDDGTPLPRITPRRYSTELSWRYQQFHAFGQVQHSEAQDRVAPQETTTESYTLVNLSASWQFQLGTLDHQLLLRAQNLTDEEARIHTSFIKDLVLQPGRNISMSYRLLF